MVHESRNNPLEFELRNYQGDLDSDDSINDPMIEEPLDRRSDAVDAEYGDELDKVAIHNLDTDAEDEKAQQ